MASYVPELKATYTHTWLRGHHLTQAARDGTWEALTLNAPFRGT